MKSQQGQALAEGVLALLLSCLLWVAIVQISQLQDVAIQAQNASRVAAFQAVHDTLDTDTDATRQHYFADTPHRWRDHAGRRFIPEPETQVVLHLKQTAGLPAQAQPGQQAPHAVRLRREWRAEDQGVVRADARVQVAVPFSLQTHMHIRRHTTVLRDAAHSPDAQSTQRRVGESPSAWATAAQQSRVAGQRAQAVLAPVDAAWHRPAPSWDWLMPWAGQSPALVSHD